MNLYTHPQETWDTAECSRRARFAPVDAYGNRPPRGIIASSASTYAQYGQTVYFNGGMLVDGVLYSGEYNPLPLIPPEFEFVSLPTWGTAIRKKQS